MTSIIFTTEEIQSGFSRVAFAEKLILQLPKDHDGRNTWLLNYGKSEEATALRKKWNSEHSRHAPLIWNRITESVNPIE